MINLASADFLFLVGVPFQVAEDIYMRWTLGSFACSVSKFVTYLNFMVSVGNICRDVHQLLGKTALNCVISRLMPLFITYCTCEVLLP